MNTGCEPVAFWLQIHCHKLKAMETKAVIELSIYARQKLIIMTVIIPPPPLSCDIGNLSH